MKDKMEKLNKQLSRKEQECNNLYAQIEADNKYHKEEENNLRKIIEKQRKRNTESYKEIQCLQAENKELKEYIEANKATGICETCTHKAIQENDYYRRAFKNIEEIYERDEDGDYDFIKFKILNIINEVKDK